MPLWWYEALDQTRCLNVIKKCYYWNSSRTSQLPEIIGGEEVCIRRFRHLLFNNFISSSLCHTNPSILDKYYIKIPYCWRCNINQVTTRSEKVSHLGHTLHQHHPNLFEHHTLSQNRQIPTWNCNQQLRSSNEEGSHNLRNCWKIIKNSWWIWFFKSYTALCLPCCQFSQINPAIVRPLPTPAPSPMKKPALWPVGRWWRCLCHTTKQIFTCVIL